MSRLYYSEAGHVVPTLCEELADYRRARKTIELPATDAPATLFFLARPYHGNRLPLRVAVNGREVAAVQPATPDTYTWYEVELQRGTLLPGTNTFDFWTDSHAMDSWSLGLECGHKEPGSFISTDGGKSWRNEKMSHLNTSRGEYVARVRLEEGNDPPPPSPVLEDPQNPRVQRLRRSIPPYVLEGGSTLARVRALCTRVCTSWEYRNSGPAAQYAPWDAETIISWGRAKRGHDGRLPIVMCVHYAVALVGYCSAAGIPARCAVFTGDINGFNGHFTAEVWFEEHKKWVMVDPTIDAILFRDGVPMSVTEIQRAGGDLSGFVEWGPGYNFQVQNPTIEEWIPKTFLTGICFRHRSAWYRADLLSHPEYSPPGHGCTSYCETGLVWETKDLREGFGMFPYFGEQGYFDAPPP